MLEKLIFCKTKKNQQKDNKQLEYKNQTKKESHDFCTTASRAFVLLLAVHVNLIKKQNKIWFRKVFSTVWEFALI